LCDFLERFAVCPTRTKKIYPDEHLSKKTRRPSIQAMHQRILIFYLGQIVHQDRRGVRRKVDGGQQHGEMTAVADGCNEVKG
jgi:hypothetical protein